MGTKGKGKMENYEIAISILTAIIILGWYIWAIINGVTELTATNLTHRTESEAVKVTRYWELEK